MDTECYRFEIQPAVEFRDAIAALEHAVGAAEGLHGQAEVRLDSASRADESDRSITVDATTLVGAELTRILIGVLTRRFGAEAFTVKRTAMPATIAAAAS